MQKIMLILEDGEYFLQIVNDVNDTVITRLKMTKKRIRLLS